MPNPISRYRISSRNLEVDKTLVRKLIDGALNAADEEIHFSKYDSTVILMAAKVKEYGMFSLCGYPGMLGWRAKEALRTKRGERVNGGVAIFCY